MRVLAEQEISQGGVQTIPHIFKNCEYTLCNPRLLTPKEMFMPSAVFMNDKAYVLSPV